MKGPLYLKPIGPENETILGRVVLVSLRVVNGDVILYVNDEPQIWRLGEYPFGEWAAENCER